MGSIIAAAEACAFNVRNVNLRHAQAAFGLVWMGEWAVTVAAGVIAFHDGGATAVGLVAVARMLPAALVAPVAATIADRARRDRVLALVATVRALTLSLAGVVSVAGGPVVLVYAALVVATVAQTLFRPTHSALLPALCGTPAELTSANVVRGLLDSVATLVGPLAAAALLALSGPGAVLFAASVASALAATLIATLRYEAPPTIETTPPGTGAVWAIEGVREIARDRALALLTALTSLQTFVRGALTVLLVSLALSLLHSSNAGVGVLTAAIGAGAVAGSLSAALLVGRGGLARWFGIGVAAWGAPLLVLGARPAWAAAIAMLAIVGVGNSLVDVGVFTLIARLADDRVLARVFAAFEGIITFGVAAGALLTPALISAAGTRLTFVIVGATTPLAVLASWAPLRRIDHQMRVRDADVALLRAIPMFRVLPETTLEQLASRLTTVRLPAAATVFEQGDDASEFFVIENGQAQVVIDGRNVNALAAGDGFGEVALMRAGRRTASVRAATPLTLRGLNRAVFVAAMTGYSPSTEVVDHVIDAHLSRFAAADDTPFRELNS